MTRPSRWRVWRGRAGLALSTLLLASIVGLAVLVPTAALTVEHTARPEFCNTCHIMEPYYESWVSSSHADVGCIECHYEPGTLETVEGKFKALSQLAKYVTRTQGTKPWAEVSDYSCMRSGCHSVRMLEGSIAFGKVKFDHRHHLLESRRGRKLRCTSCHSQIVQGDHVSVTDAVCFMCHFMPDADGKVPEPTSDCLMCHGPPVDPVDVAGRLFAHTEYIERGVGCRECHVPVIEGDGTVRSERCHSCHGELGHIERIAETEFLHEMHVTEHKVECFECHDEIHHGLLPLEPVEPPTSSGCGACHFDSHDATRLVYSGTGAREVADRPSRMYETRVVCSACHTGRAGILDGDGAVHGAHAGSWRGAVAAAGEVDCIHCHGIEYDGMLGRWQGEIGAQLERLHPLLAELGERLPEDGEAPAHRLYEEARFNLELISKDGSRGAHNVPYVLDVLCAVAERLDEAVTLVDPDVEPTARAGLPHVSADGCTACHLGVERAPLEVHGRPFAHDRHTAVAGLDCRDCHSVTDPGGAEHGAPAFARTECASCHHEERDDEAFDPWDCSACHAHQESFLTGTLEGWEETLGGMEEKDCDACHGEPPDIASPSPKMCVLCHDETYEGRLDAWRHETDELVTRIRGALAAPGVDVDPDALERARRALRAVAADGSGGAHNMELVRKMLGEALEGL